MSHSENPQSLWGHTRAVAGAPSPVPGRKSNQAGGGWQNYYYCHKNADGSLFPVQIGKENCPARPLMDMAHWFLEALLWPAYSLYILSPENLMLPM